MLAGCEQGIIKGMYLLEDGRSKAYKVTKPISKDLHMRLLGSGTMLREFARLQRYSERTIQCWSMSGVLPTTTNSAGKRWR